MTSNNNAIITPTLFQSYIKASMATITHSPHRLLGPCDQYNGVMTLRRKDTTPVFLVLPRTCSEAQPHRSLYAVCVPAVPSKHAYLLLVRARPRTVEYLYLFILWAGVFPVVCGIAQARLINNSYRNEFARVSWIIYLPPQKLLVFGVDIYFYENI